MTGAGWSLPIPEHLQTIIVEFARFGPTPSAMVLKERLQACPWVPAIINEFPHVHPGNIILQADEIGLEPCVKCDTCAYATLHRIRYQFEPEVANWWFALDSDDDATYTPAER